MNEVMSGKLKHEERTCWTNKMVPGRKP